MGRQPRSIIVRLASTESGSVFFQPLQLHLEEADLLVDLFFILLLLAVMTGSSAT
jgi:hypothetical protein